MPELETLFVRIETDLSAFKRGMTDARNQTQDFAKEARSTFSTVGDALDLSKFRNQLTATETAAKKSAERMKTAFAEVSKAQRHTAEKALQRLAQPSGSSFPVANQSASNQGERAFGFSKAEEEAFARFQGAATGMAFGTGALLAAEILSIPLSGGTSLLILGGSGVAGFFSPEIIKGVFGDDSRSGTTLDDLIKNLDRSISVLESQKRFIDPFTSDIAKQKQSEAQAEIDATTALRDALLEQQRQTRESTSQYQDLIGAMAELCTCLRDLGTRIDSLAPLPPGGAGVPGAQRMRFDGAGVGAGGGIIPASFSGASPFDGNGLALFNEELEATGWHAGDAAVQIADLTERAGGFRTEAGALVRVLRANNAVFDDQVGVVRLLDALLPELGAGLTGVFTEAGAAGREFDDVAEALGGTLIAAFKGAALEGKSLRDVLRNVLNDILVLSQSSLGGGGGGSFLGTLLNSAVGAITGSFTTAPSGPGPGAGPPMRGALPAPFVPSAPFSIELRTAAKGGVFARGATLPEALAQGGVLHNSVVSRPTLFAMAKGYGLMGEAGPEAVMPLTRLPNGELGVRGMAGGAGSGFAGNRTVNISIDARGADRGAIADLRRSVNELAQAINHDRASFRNNVLGTVMEARSRGGNIARAFGGW